MNTTQLSTVQTAGTTSTQMGGREPPVIKGALPLLGHMLAFARNPYIFLQRARAQAGDVAAFKLFGQRMVLLTGDEASGAFYRAADEQLDQSAAYQLMTPIFGEGVIFDAPIERKNQQLKMLMPALRDKPMRGYAGLIVDEVEAMIRNWGERGTVELTEFMKQLTIYTSSHCLLGPEFRHELNEEFAHIYHDLEGGVTPLAYNFPNAPIPAFRRRDKARVRLQQLVTEIMSRRQKKTQPSNDMFQMLIDAHYEDGSKLNAYEITGMLIGAIFAGHHTSSGTAAWVLIEMLKHPQLLKRAVSEVDRVFSGNRAIDFQALRELTELENIIKEVLRLHPPLIILMRKVVHDFQVKGFTIRAGDLVCASPPVTHRIPELFPNPEVFDPDRYLPDRGEDKNLNAWQPFGGGRHKCSGNAFALFQIKAIFAVLLKRYSFELVDAPHSYVDNYHSTIVQPKAPCNVRYRLRRDSPAQQTTVQATAPSGRCPFSGAAAAHKSVTITIDKTLCQGHAVCMGESPELFFVAEDSAATATLINAHPDNPELIAKARQAAALCPNRAIQVTES